MSCAGNHVNNIAVMREDFWQSQDDIFYALIGRQQAKREQNIFSFRPEAVLVEVWIGEGQIGDAMRNQIDLVARNVEHFLQDLCGVPAHDDHAVRKGRNLFHHRALVGIWIAKYRVQRGCDRHLQSPQ